MKKIIFVLFFLLFGRTQTFAHKQHVHQYIVHEAYNLLKLQVGEIPTMASHISTDEGGGGGTWASGLITAGAWNEDEEDVVYHIKEAPYNKPFISSTHFWDADQGDDNESRLQGKRTGIYFSFTVQNAYQKIRAYRDGGWTMLWNNGGGGSGQFEYDTPDGEVRYYNWVYAIGFQYQSLVDFYKTGRAKIVGTYQEDGTWVSDNVDIVLS